MANETIKLEPVELSQLPIIDNPSGFWIFGSKTASNGTLTSGRYLLDKIEEYAKSLQLERRIPITTEADFFRLFFGEQTTLYAVDTLNVSEINIKVGSTNYKIITSSTSSVPMSVTIPARTRVEFTLTRQLTDSEMNLFFYGKSKI